MTNQRDEFGPYWLQTAAPFGAQPGPPGAPWPFPRINSALLAMFDSSKLPIPPATPPWFPAAAPTGVPAAVAPEHLESAKYWGAAPALPAVPAPLSNRGVLGSLGAPQYGADGATPEPPAQSRNYFDRADLGKSLGIGVANGAINTLTAPGDAREMIAQGVQKATDYLAPGYGEPVGTFVSRGLAGLPYFSGPTSSDIRGAIEPITGPFYEPKTVAGDYARGIGEAMPGLAGPGGLLRNAGRYVVLPALASETAGQWAKGTWAEPFARFLASLATAGTAAAISHAPRGAPMRSSPGQPPRAVGAKEGGYPYNSPESSGASRDAPKSPWEKTAYMLPPPSKPPRPFSADYPSGAPTDDAGRLLFDIEGRPLKAEYVAGRRTAGGEDVGLTPAEVWHVAKKATGQEPELATERKLQGRAGVYDPNTRKIGIDKDLIPEQKHYVLFHETGHGLHHLAAKESLKSMQKMEQELMPVYGDLNARRPGIPRPARPQDLDYPDAAAPYELVAEGFRGYLINPNYFKSVAPYAASVYRGWVNSHPRLSKILQLNGLGGLAVLGGEIDDRLDDKSDGQAASGM